jgi:hypothetical protein
MKLLNMIIRTQSFIPTVDLLTENLKDLTLPSKITLMKSNMGQLKLVENKELSKLLIIELTVWQNLDGIKKPLLTTQV